MPDCSLGTLYLGGRIHRRRLPQIADAFKEAGYEFPDTEEALLAELDEDGHFELEDDDAVGGMFSDLEDALTKLQVDFDRYACGSHYYSGEHLFARDGERYSYYTDQDGAPSIGTKTLAALREHLCRGDAKEALAVLDAAIPDVKPLGRLEIVGEAKPALGAKKTGKAPRKVTRKARS